MTLPVKVTLAIKFSKNLESFAVQYFNLCYKNFTWLKNVVFPILTEIYHGRIKGIKWIDHQHNFENEKTPNPLVVLHYSDSTSFLYTWKRRIEVNSRQSDGG